ncbi:ComEA family DNA-binding protein [Nocardiopsis kunsanensis]|uniref:Helix-hairpin-helix DNA-binding motif class 1 domain-containing protein n=1 Tax=Nocardiopsis kunsanensis TaxID=141693 RepID=A0A918X6H1_9ACTN|nr:ComEA family DNA-binding protein [Nocardiopsis kunsanensis]GHD14503.1 hypothetical protein GCM10007147_00610 [Nocardiopsis kunsanensis]
MEARSPAGADTGDELSPSATDPDDDLLDGTVTTRLRPRRAPSPHTPDPTGTAHGPGPSGRTRGARANGQAPSTSEHTAAEDPPISTEVLRDHRPRIPTGPSSATAESARPSPPSHVERELPDDGTVRLRPRSPAPAHPGSGTAPRPPTARKWVGHRPLGEQPREYRRPSWPVHPPSGKQRSTASADWPDRDPEDTVAVAAPVPGTAPGRRSREPEGSPWLDPCDEEVLKERRPPSGYVEFDTDDAADGPMNRLARWWGPNAALSKRAVVALFVLGAAAVLAALLFLRREPEEVDLPEMAPQAAPESGGSGDGATEDGTAGDGAGPGADEDVVVHVGGAVEEPGLYTLPSGARVLDAVEEAGGALPDADLDLVNLARPVADGERILLGSEVAAEDAEDEGGQDGGRISLNQADGAALEALPGIGEAKAEAILEHRDSLGGSFSDVEELMEVSGIGQSTFDGLEDRVML